MSIPRRRVLVGTLAIVSGLLVVLWMTNRSPGSRTALAPGTSGSSNNDVNAMSDAPRQGDMLRAALDAGAEPRPSTREAQTVRRDRNEISSHPNGKLRSRVTLDAEGRRQGTYEAWYDTGVVWETGNFLGGKKEGLFTGYYKEGTLRDSVTYHDGVMSGVLTQWYESGQKWGEQVLVEGRRDGRSTVWYPNGQMKMQGEYSQGKRTGRWLFWNEDGLIDETSSGTYEQDQRISH